MNPRPGPSLDLSPSCDGCIGRSDTMDRDSRVHSSTLVYLFHVILTLPFIQLVSYGESKAYGQRHFRHDAIPRLIFRFPYGMCLTFFVCMVICVMRET